MMGANRGRGTDAPVRFYMTQAPSVSLEALLDEVAPGVVGAQAPAMVRELVAMCAEAGDAMDHPSRDAAAARIAGVSAPDLLRAIELNAVAVDNNKAAFEWGRRAAHDWASVEKLLAPAQVLQFKKRETLDDLIARRVEFLTAYQDAAYAQRYRAFVEKVRQREAPLGKTLLSESVARYLFKLMAYKDEYEVARLHTDSSFLARVDAMFEGDFKLNYHMAPPLVSRRNDKGELQKQKFGPAMLTAFRVLARLKGLRGTVWDIFGKTEERRGERALITDYMASIDEVLATLDASNLAAAVEIARIPEQIRGYGHVKARHLVAARASWQEAMARWRAPDGALQQQVLQTLGVGRA
jgi:indolepyruvate ferredoxin oxidoreductase